ncbi:EAL domain-containing response regulator [Vibrio porteresiae]|uniref:EAL domain-containing protein n=1 Tax=Vibrio porteresiae DSM 19223 TaxID=1123496 RepID=A0ABZ0QKZ8_9VIBR|nr:EAL domain-containing protein [Vibrio porteresiae]WPC76083.1 EAL domain-containing protein [Vibrio porteresiae DSM 19223]
MHFDKILLVDDELPILKSLIRTLRMEFPELYSTTCVDEALEIVKRERIGVVISDFRMPKMNGVDLLIKIKTIDPNISTIMLSGQAELSDVTRALNVGALHKFISKPWDSVELVEEIRHAISKQGEFAHVDILTKCKPIRKLNELVTEVNNNGNDMSKLVLIADLQETSSLNSNYGVPKVNSILESLGDYLKRSLKLDVYREQDKFFVVVDCSAESTSLLSETIERMLSFPHADPEQPEFKLRLLISEISSWEEVSSQEVNERKSYIEKLDKRDLYWLGDEGEEQDELKQLVRFLLENGSDNFVAFFQPQVNVETGLVDGCEALVRRRLADGQYELPTKFVPMLTKYNFIDDLTKAVIKQSMTLLPELLAKKLDLRVAINTTATQLEKGILRQFLISENGPIENVDKIDIEVTETQHINDYTLARKEMEALKALGVRLAIDDFGTGYSGFETICELPFDVLKIDGRFIKALGRSHADDAILNSITDSAKSLNMEIVAEWVEDARQLDVLRKQGCKYVQGYLFSPPLERDEFIRYVLDKNGVRDDD